MRLLQILIILLLAVCLLCGGEDSTGKKYSRECMTWKQEARRIENEPRVDVSCRPNDPCSGLDCTGLYSYNGSLVSGKYEKNICFGLWMDPCSNPTVLKVYLEQTSDNISFVHTMTANENNGHDETQIPGAVESLHVAGLGGIGQVTVVLVTDFKSDMIGNRNYVTLGVWLVKDVEVPVPPCDRNVPLPTHTAYTCPEIFSEKAPDPPQDVKVLMTGHDFAVCQWTPPAPKEDADAKYYTVQYTEQGGKTQHQSFKSPPAVIFDLKVNTNYSFSVVAVNTGGNSKPTKTVTAATQNSSAATGSLFQSCDPSEEKVSECGQGQVCDLRSRRCQCIFGSFKLSEDMTCVQAQPVTTEKPVILTDIYILDVPGGGGKMKKSTMITVVSCVVAVVIVAVLAVLVYMYYRKKKARYSQHTLLRNVEEERAADDDDVAPISP